MPEGKSNHQGAKIQIGHLISKGMEALMIQLNLSNRIIILEMPTIYRNFDIYSLIAIFQVREMLKRHTEETAAN